MMEYIFILAVALGWHKCCESNTVLGDISTKTKEKTVGDKGLEPLTSTV